MQVTSTKSKLRKIECRTKEARAHRPSLLLLLTHHLSLITYHLSLITYHLSLKRCWPGGQTFLRSFESAGVVGTAVALDELLGGYLTRLAVLDGDGLQGY